MSSSRRERLAARIEAGWEWRKDEDSEHRERRYRLRVRSEWVVTGISDLRIIDDALAAAVDAELDSMTRLDKRPIRTGRSVEI